VSGGEEGARYGPSLVLGGNEEAWPYIKGFSKALRPKVMASLAVSGLVTKVLVITSRWFTMVLNMAICS